METLLRELEKKMKTEGATKANLREFWKLVNHAKLEKQVSDDTLDRINRLRGVLFNEFYPSLLSLRQGLALAAAATLLGAALIWYSLRYDKLLFFLIGVALVMVGTHPLGHWIAGKLVRVNYEYFYLDGPAKFEPCLKIHYVDYLKSSFNSRIIVHACGALTTVLTALILLLATITTEAVLIRGVAVAIFALVIITEVVSWAGFTAGDMKRARNERNLKRVYMKREKH